MRLASQAAAVVLLAGAVTTTCALLWWGLTYWPVWNYDYLPLTQASKCLVRDSTICRLAASLCTGEHRALVTMYSPVAFWTGATLLVGGLVGVQRAMSR